MKLSSTEKIIYDYLTKTNIKNMSADEIAGKLFVSRASIYRVCSKMGYASFSEFKHVFYKKKQQVETVDSLSVFNHVNDLQLIAILDRISHSEQVYVFGTRATNLLSNYFSRQLVNLGYSSILIVDEYELESRCQIFNATDCIVCFSNRGHYTPNVLEIIDEAPIEVIAVAKEDSPLTKISNYAITFDFPIDVNKAYERENLFNLMVITENILVNLKKYGNDGYRRKGERNKEN